MASFDILRAVLTFCIGGLDPDLDLDLRSKVRIRSRVSLCI